MFATDLELHTEFKNSDYGRDLEQKTRFNVFKPDWVTTEQWGRFLGDDVNNLYHMPYTHELATRFALYEGLGEAATNLLKLTAITHDWGEAKIGDIPLPEKTAEHERAEKLGFLAIARELYGGERGDMLTERVWRVLDHEDKVHGDMFRAIEYLGYCTTAMIAGNVATKIAHGFFKVDVDRESKELLIGGLLAMEREVTIHNFPVLSTYVEKYPSIPDQIKEIRL